MAINQVRASELRDPEVLAAAHHAPIRVIDHRRGDTLVLTSELDYVTRQQLEVLDRLLMSAVVEIERETPNATHLGEAGYVAGWPIELRRWWVRGFAESLVKAHAARTPAVASGFIAVARSADSSDSSPLGRPLEREDLPERLARRLVRR